MRQPNSRTDPAHIGPGTGMPGPIISQPKGTTNMTDTKKTSPLQPTNRRLDTWKCADGTVIPVRDATKAINLVIGVKHNEAAAKATAKLDEQIAKAIAKGMCAADLEIQRGQVCPVWKAAADQLGATEGVVLKRTAYFDHFDENGDRVMLRYMLPARTERFIRNVDCKGKARGQLLECTPATPGRTIVGNRLRAKLQREGKLEKKGSRPNYPKKRGGSTAIQFGVAHLRGGLKLISRMIHTA
jgi:hypothetical protein